MKINNREAMYRSFSGYSVTLSLINPNDEKTSKATMIVDGSFANELQAGNHAKATYSDAIGNVAYRVDSCTRFTKKIAMYLDDFVKYGFEVDDNMKPVENQD